jgi:hypothetical protein
MNDTKKMGTIPNKDELVGTSTVPCNRHLIAKKDAKQTLALYLTSHANGVPGFVLTTRTTNLPGMLLEPSPMHGKHSTENSAY